MKLAAILISVVASNFAYPAQAEDSPKSFQCPESLPSDAAREEAVKSYVDWVTKNHPDWTISQIAASRVALLEAHHCERTLAYMRAEARKSNSPASVRQACIRPNGTRYFTAAGGGNCAPVPIESGWVNFQLSQDYIVDVLPDRIVREADGVKLWTQFFLAAPSDSSDARWRYDHLKSVTKYFCKTKQMLLIQGTYSLRGTVTYERLSNEAVTEEIEPGTVSEELYDYVCRA
jgi:hypothetical protein